MRLNKFRKINQSGDTIVEVMIVLAILGLAISIAYATANRSLLNARQAQETSTATELVQSQVETLLALSPNLPTDATHYIYQVTPFCIDSSGAVQLTPPNPCQFGNNNLYHILISWSNSTDDTFTAKAIWNDVRGNGQDTVTLIYRVHQ